MGNDVVLGNRTLLCFVFFRLCPAFLRFPGRHLAKDRIVFGINEIFDRFQRSLSLLLAGEREQESLFRDDIRAARIGVEVAREIPRREAGLFERLNQKERAQVHHFRLLFEEHAHRVRMARIRLSVRGFFRFHGRRLLFGGRGLRRRGGLAVFRFLSGNLFEEIVNFLFQSADICSERLVVFDLFHFRLQEVARLEHQVDKRLVIFGGDSVFPDIKEQVFHFMGDRRQTVKLHHRGGAFDRVHDPKDLVDAVGIKGARLLALKKDLIQMREQIVRFKQINLEHGFHVVVHHSHRLIKLYILYIGIDGS